MSILPRVTLTKCALSWGRCFHGKAPLMPMTLSLVRAATIPNGIVGFGRFDALLLNAVNGCLSDGADNGEKTALLRIATTKFIVLLCEGRSTSESCCCSFLCAHVIVSKAKGLT